MPRRKRFVEIIGVPVDLGAGRLRYKAPILAAELAQGVLGKRIL